MSKKKRQRQAALLSGGNTTNVTHNWAGAFPNATNSHEIEKAIRRVQAKDYFASRRPGSYQGVRAGILPPAQRRTGMATVSVAAVGEKTTDEVPPHSRICPNRGGNRVRDRGAVGITLSA